MTGDSHFPPGHLTSKTALFSDDGSKLLPFAWTAENSHRKLTFAAYYFYLDNSLKASNVGVYWPGTRLNAKFVGELERVVKQQ